MNASELADYLLNFIMMIEDYDESKHENAATMLRQQQAEKEALKDTIAAIEKNTDYWADKANWIKPNKPVAELVLEQMIVGDASSLRVKWLTDSYPPVGTQLYTHPVKEQLTDEEIQEVYSKQHEIPCNILGFAKAILRKASEK